MSFILNIDTAVEAGSVCLSLKDKPLIVRTNPNQKDSAAWMHIAIREILEEKGVELSRLSAVAVSAGPGSYTGLRVGMSAAKGLCYALQLPLITINTLQLMAASVPTLETGLICPMIDARRMEVFAAVFDRDLNEVVPPTNLVLDKQSFTKQLDNTPVLFFGNGSTKFKNITDHPNAIFAQLAFSAANMVSLSYQKYSNSDFASLAYAEPFYGKDFHSIIPNS